MWAWICDWAKRCKNVCVNINFGRSTIILSTKLPVFTSNYNFHFCFDFNGVIVYKWYVHWKTIKSQISSSCDQSYYILLLLLLLLLKFSCWIAATEVSGEVSFVIRSALYLISPHCKMRERLYTKFITNFILLDACAIKKCIRRNNFSDNIDSSYYIDRYQFTTNSWKVFYMPTGANGDGLWSTMHVMRKSFFGERGGSFPTKLMKSWIRTSVQKGVILRHTASSTFFILFFKSPFIKKMLEALYSRHNF